jgi:hypothetical protein
MNGYRFTVERHRLCIWLEKEKARLSGLSAAERERKTLELERQFRIKLDSLYEQVAPELVRKPEPELH